MFTVKLTSYNTFIGINTDNPTEKSWSSTPMSTDEQYTVVDIEGDVPTIRLYDYVTTTASPQTTDIAIMAQNGCGRILSDKSFAFFLNADNTSGEVVDFRIVKNADRFINEVTLFKVNTDGYAASRGMKVTQGNFPDYVFDKKYKLTKLEEVEEYIKENQRLPEMPSAKEVNKDGLDLGEVLTLAIKKIEELTLYIIASDKENKELKDELQRQNKEIEVIKGRLK